MLIGNAVVGQSGGPTSAINATLKGVIAAAEAAREDGFIKALYGMRNGIEGFLEERLCDLFEEFKEPRDLDDLAVTPSAALGSCRRRLNPHTDDPETYRQIFSLFEKYDIRYFFYIGGNDSMDTVWKLSSYAEEFGHEIRFIGVPKTIDNDLVGTDHTPGFGSAAKFVATTVKELLRDINVYTARAVTIVEIMGRDAGWLTSAAALPLLSGGVGPDLVYLPERVFSRERFLADLERKLSEHPAVLVAVSEGVRLADGSYVGEAAQSGSTDAFGHRYLSGVGKALELLVKEKLGCKVRSLALSLPQRAAAHLASLTDLTEAEQVGAAAVRLATEGHTGVMAALVRSEGDYAVTVVPRPVGEVANKIRTVPDAFLNAEGNGVTDACLSYLLPLILGEVPVRYENGMPRHYVIGE